MAIKYITRTPRQIYDIARAYGWPATEALRCVFNPRHPDAIWPWCGGVDTIAGLAQHLRGKDVAETRARQHEVTHG